MQCSFIFLMFLMRLTTLQGIVGSNGEVSSESGITIFWHYNFVRKIVINFRPTNQYLLKFIGTNDSREVELYGYSMIASFVYDIGTEFTLIAVPQIDGKNRTDLQMIDKIIIDYRDFTIQGINKFIPNATHALLTLDNGASPRIIHRRSTYHYMVTDSRGDVITDNQGTDLIIPLPMPDDWIKIAIQNVQYLEVSITFHLFRKDLTLLHHSKLNNIIPYKYEYILSPDCHKKTGSQFECVKYIGYGINATRQDRYSILEKKIEENASSLTIESHSNFQRTFIIHFSRPIPDELIVNVDGVEILTHKITDPLTVITSNFTWVRGNLYNITLIPVFNGIKRMDLSLYNKVQITSLDYKILDYGLSAVNSTHAGLGIYHEVPHVIESHETKYEYSLTYSNNKSILTAQLPSVSKLVFLLPDFGQYIDIAIHNMEYPNITLNLILSRYNETLHHHMMLSVIFPQTIEFILASECNIERSIQQFRCKKYKGYDSKMNLKLTIITNYL